jgi:ligand-binding sensor domain-containing protein/serine phosphatase RsbU (regulator of sigma subunit)
MTMRVPFRTIAACMIALFIRPAADAQQTLRFEHLTVKQGLSQGSVICIMQDSRGFLWFGTLDGLNRYDAYGCEVFRHDDADSTTLTDNFITSIAETPDSTLWIGTLNAPALLNRYDPATESFTRVARDSVDLTGARIGYARSEYTDTSGRHWSGTVGGGLTRRDLRTGATKTFLHDPADPASLSDNRVYAVVGDRTGMLWVGTREGLDCLRPGTDTFIHYRHDEKNPRSLSDNWVWPLLEDRNGVLWVGTFRGGLNRFDRAAGTFTRYRHDESDPRSLAGDRVYSLAEDQSGMIWVGLGDNGVDRFHPGMAAFRHYRHDPQEPSSLVDNNITSLFVDRGGVAWIGTRSGLDRWDRTSGIFRHSLNKPPSSAAAGDAVQCMMQDRAGILWLGTLSSGLARLDPASGRLTYYRHDPTDARSVSDDRIYALCEDRTGSIWVGTYGGGLNRFNASTGEFTRFMQNDTIPGSLGGPGVWSLLVDRDGVLWVGTYGGGLDRFNAATDIFTHFAHDEANPQSLSDNIVLSLHQDREGTLWVGTNQGLNAMESSSGAFRQYHQKDGLPNEVILGILEDGEGNLWMSTNKGIARFNRRQGRFRNYTHDDGLQGDEFNQGASARDPRTGEMLFGGSAGFNIFHPAEVMDNPYIPPVVFTSFLRYNTDDEEGRPIAERGIAAHPDITLSYKDNISAIEFAALNFYNTSRNQYAYKLEGFSDNWIQIGTDRRATFTNLDAGTYTLRVRGSNNDGIWNDAGAALRLTVTPPWWKTRWAYGLYAVLAFGSLYGIRTVEIRRREQKAQIRESQLRAKAVEAEKRALEAENARKSKELEDARQLQISMLPKEVPLLPGFEIAVYMKTATEVGGDYYDFNVADDGTLSVAFGDATGHGMQAGTIVTLMKGLFVSDVSRFAVLEFLNHCSRAIKEIKMGRLFMAFSLVRLKDRTVALSSAGMPPVYLYRHASRAVEEIFVKGMPLGAMKQPQYDLYEAALAQGDTLLLLTDGLPEQKNARGELFDYARVQDAFGKAAGGSPDAIVRQLVGEVGTWMVGAPQEDDITLLAIRCTG